MAMHACVMPDVSHHRVRICVLHRVDSERKFQVDAINAWMHACALRGTWR